MIEATGPDQKRGAASVVDHGGMTWGGVLAYNPARDVHKGTGTLANAASHTGSKGGIGAKKVLQYSNRA